MTRAWLVSLLVVLLSFVQGCKRRGGAQDNVAAPVTVSLAQDAPPEVVAKAASAPGKDAVANGLDTAALCELAEMPTVRVKYGFQVRSSERDGHGNPIDPAKEVAKLLAKLDGSIGDAETYLELSSQYDTLKNEAKSSEAARKAEELLRPHANTSNPREANLLVLYARARCMLEPHRWQEREALLQRAVKLDPDDWQAWSGLADIMFGSAPYLLLDQPAKDQPAEEHQSKALQALGSGEAPVAVVAQLEQRFKNAAEYSECAKKLAPHSEKQWIAHLGHLMQDMRWTGALKAPRGEPSTRLSDFPGLEDVGRGFAGDPRFSLAALPGLHDFEAAAKGCPDSLTMQFMGVMTLWSTYQKRKAQAEVMNRELRLSPEEFRYFKDTLSRLDKIAAAAGPEAKVHCQQVATYSRLFATLMFRPTELARVEPHIRKLVEVDPKNQDGLELFEFILHQKGKYTEALEVARKRLAAHATPRNHFLLARALDGERKKDEAMKELAAGLRLDPQDGYCLSGRAALLLRRAEDKQALAEAGKMLEQARAASKPDTEPQLIRDLEFLAALHTALTGDIKLARLSLEAMRAQDGDNRYVEALAALPPAEEQDSSDLAEAPPTSGPIPELGVEPVETPVGSKVFGDVSVPSNGSLLNRNPKTPAPQGPPMAELLPPVESMSSPRLPPAYSTSPSAPLAPPPMLPPEPR